MPEHAFFMWHAEVNGASLNYRRKLGKEKHMKKHETRQKLTLSRETLRRLDSAQLAAVAGGSVITCIPAKCTSGYFSPPEG
jgi:hypothetical protein